MKSELQSWSPTELIWAIGASNAITSLTAVLFAILSWRQALSVSNQRYAMVLVVTGILVGLTAEIALRRGARSRRWPDSVLSAPRRFLEHPALIGFSWSMFLVALLYCIVSPLQNAALAAIFMALPFSFMRADNYLRPRQQVTGGGSGAALYSGEPLNSDHWKAASH